MKKALIILVVAVAAWALGPEARPNGGTTPAAIAANAEGCEIAGMPDGSVPPLQAAPIAELLPSQMEKLEKAYFSMGCFWGSEAMLASCPGVIFTEVGFSGGSLADPSYSAIGDHVETVEVLFDPDRVSYSQLLEHFWDHHNGRAKPIFRQYASAIFAVDERQERLAKEVRTGRERSAAEAEPLLTAIQRLSRFYPADSAHQKYYLSQDPELLAKMPRYGEQKLDTRLATKLNALAGHAGDRQDVKAGLAELGLAEHVSEALLLRASWP